MAHSQACFLNDARLGLGSGLGNDIRTSKASNGADGADNEPKDE